MNIVSDVTPNFATERAISEACWTIHEKKLYGKWNEARNLWCICKSCIPWGKSWNDYGVPERTLRKYEDEILIKVRKFLGKDTIKKNELMNPPYKDSTNFMISNLKLDHTGPPSPLRAVDRDILAVRMDELNMCGFGLEQASKRRK